MKIFILEVSVKTELPDFVHKNAWWTIQHLGLKMNFLQLSPADGPECDSYQESRHI